MVMLPSPTTEELLLHDQLCAAGLKRIHQGKVRDTYTLPDPNLLLLYATNRLSIFDFVLNCHVREKGQVLTALTVFWPQKVTKHPNHLVAFGIGIDQFLPVSLRGNQLLQKNALVVYKLEMLPVECIVRGYLTGSAWAKYQKNQSAYGYDLPPGLHDGSKLPQPLFTPTTKAEDGHDLPIPVEEVIDKYGPSIATVSLKIYEQAAEHCLRQGFILADTKFEFGSNGYWADEFVTPDSSRFWHKKQWEEACALGKAPTSYDKEVVRQWGKKVETPFGVTGIHKLDPQNSDHLKFVNGLSVPDEVLEFCRTQYRTICAAITGLSLEYFQRNVMGIEDHR